MEYNRKVSLINDESFRYVESSLIVSGISVGISFSEAAAVTSFSTLRIDIATYCDISNSPLIIRLLDTLIKNQFFLNQNLFLSP